MKCTLVNFNSPVTALHKPSLTPELMAATGARYSRNNEGLDNILSKIDFNDPDKSVDSIFRMVDYGHASIGDMAPVAIFMDDISILLAYWMWSICPCASGQESSTRYIRFNKDGVMNVEELGMENSINPQNGGYPLYTAQANSLLCYEKAYSMWLEYGRNNPETMKVPESLKTTDEKKYLRLMRNFAFDRARVFLPLSAKTNMMMIQSARNWVETISYLLSCPTQEFQYLGNLLKEELNLATPRLTKHATPKESYTNLFEQEVEKAKRKYSTLNTKYKINPPTKARIEVHAFDDSINDDTLSYITDIIKCRENRYSKFPPEVNLCAVNFKWENATMGEIRDLNRHRTGNKHMSLCSTGFYCASDQVNQGTDIYNTLTQFAKKEMRENYEMYAGELMNDNFEALYYLSLGNTFEFQHTTTLDKYFYELELRTGLGAHYRYKDMMLETTTAFDKSIIENLFIGTGEPEI